MSPVMSDGASSQARPLFRRLAAVVVVLCFFLAGLFGLFLDDGKWLFIGLCIFVGFVMATIASTGQWPPPKSRGRST
jgi:hypothetical protein